MHVEFVDDGKQAGKTSGEPLRSLDGVAGQDDLPHITWEEMAYSKEALLQVLNAQRASAMQDA